MSTGKETQIEDTHVDTEVGEEKGVMNWEVKIDIYTLPYKIYS